MNHNVYAVRMRHNPEVFQRSYVETHLALAQTDMEARRHVEAKVRRIGSRTAQFIDVTPLTVPVDGQRGVVAPTQPFQVGTANIDYSDEEDVARRAAVGRALADIGMVSNAREENRRTDFENALIRQGFKVVNAKTGR